MDVNATGYTQQMQTQMRKMDGSGGGQGQSGGMRDIMQSLSSEDRDIIKTELSTMSQGERAEMVSQMKQVDSASMTSEEYTQTLLDLLDQDSTSTTSSAAYDFSVYA
jgi:hypothetical protein